ncbi:MAG: biopolymer transporter ExbD [Opitutaceae bacterium]|nr:biopolymer transporter ExbD [Opitutaceae bacterium]
MAGTTPKAQEGAKKARIEIIPLIDVIFFLLATFVLFTLSLQRITSVPVTLPVASPPGPPNPNDNTVYLQVSDDGNYYWKQGGQGTPELITTSEIAPRLADYKRSENNPRVLVRGDTRAKFGAAVNALDEVRKSGIDQVSVETVSSPTGR